MPCVIAVFPQEEKERKKNFQGRRSLRVERLGDVDESLRNPTVNRYEEGRGRRPGRGRGEGGGGVAGAAILGRI